MSNGEDLWSAFGPEIRAWFRSGAKSNSANREVEDFLDELAPRVNKGAISVSRDTQRYFDDLQDRYPIGLNRIEWRGVRDHHFLDVLEMESGVGTDFVTQVEKLLAIRGTLEELMAGQDPESRLIWFGDDYDVSLEMQPITLLECYVVLFTTPQHSYVIPPGGQWCLNYTMEGCLYFGSAKDSRMTGPVNLDDEDTGA